jgi:transcriptional regulator of met regulon
MYIPIYLYAKQNKSIKEIEKITLEIVLGSRNFLETGDRRSRKQDTLRHSCCALRNSTVPTLRNITMHVGFQNTKEKWKEHADKYVSQFIYGTS